MLKNIQRWERERKRKGRREEGGGGGGINKCQGINVLMNVERNRTTEDVVLSGPMSQCLRVEHSMCDNK